MRSHDAYAHLGHSRKNRGLSFRFGTLITRLTSPGIANRSSTPKYAMFWLYSMRLSWPLQEVIAALSSVNLLPSGGCCSGWYRLRLLRLLQS